MFLKYPQSCVVAYCHRLSILVVTGGPCLGFTQRWSPGCCPALPSRVHPRQLHYKARANNTITLVQTEAIRVVVVCSILKLQKDQMGYRCSSDLSGVINECRSCPCTFLLIHKASSPPCRPSFFGIYIEAIPSPSVWKCKHT